MPVQLAVLYNIAKLLAEADLPIVFKGALITKLVLEESKFTAYDRQTNDIDGCWTGSEPTMEELAASLNDAFSRSDSPYVAIIGRNYGTDMTAMFKIYNSETNARIATFDLEINPPGMLNTAYYKENRLTGVAPTEIIADKIFLISSDSVFRRAKDLIDLSALIQCVEFSLGDICGILERKHRSVGAFSGFTGRIPELEHAFNKLTRVNNKPSFQEIYELLTLFFKPFIMRPATLLKWEPHEKSWKPLPAPENRP